MKNSITKSETTTSSLPIGNTNVVRRLLCWLGYHRWVNIDNSPMPSPKAGEMICWSELHECCHCKKQEYKGMGCVI